ALAGLIGMTAGLLLALAVVLLLHQLDDTIRRLDDLQAALDVPALAALAALDGESPAQRVVMLHAPLSPAAEGYRVLRTNLQFSAVARPLHTLLITSAGPAEGKSTTAANLALALAQAGRRVILVDAVLRRPSQQRLFGKPNNQGLSAALLHPTLSPLAFVCDSGISGLGLLLAGPLPPNPAELLASRRMQQIVADLAAAADVVIFDTPPTLIAADALILAAQMDGTILVTDQGRTRRVFAQQALARLVAVRARLLGAVLNRDTSQRGYDSPVYAEAPAPALTSPARRRLWWRIKPVV
ncbi:MAG: CpsD/CapB family tyrosine-protein kinase, partial [Anaerolineae bacterium]